VVHAVFETSEDFVGTCQKPDTKSILEKYLAFETFSISEEILGNR
jgi:hypothetical protein